MKGDFTQIRSRLTRRYSGVRMQQGRVQLDADFNDEATIRERAEQALGRDVIGRCGVPKQGGGFRIDSAGGTDLTISPGRIYVDGLLCELEEPGTVAVTASSTADKTVTLQSTTIAGRTVANGDLLELVDDVHPGYTVRVAGVDTGTSIVTVDELDANRFDPAAPGARARFPVLYASQPWWPTPTALDAPADPRTDIVYLDVWQRHVTAAEDPQLLEEALGGVDTSTRIQTVWQVKLVKDVGDVSCSDLGDWRPPPSGGRLTNDTVPEEPEHDPCVVPPAAGFTGLENRLYRVEVHDPSASGAATLKWSCENGSVVFPVAEFVNGGGPTNQVRLRRLGRDALLGLSLNDWVELVDDASELGGRPGTFVQIADVDELERVVTLSQAVDGYDVARHARLRRWEGGAPLPLDTTQTLELESGIRIDLDGGDFLNGDYWVFAARTATGKIEPLTDAPPQGIEHHYCPLAVVRWDEDVTTTETTRRVCRVTTVDDCRDVFPPLTDICAEDVCFDNDQCGLTDVETVQDVLDRLCEDFDLAFHKRRLHGWGVVCGLRLECEVDCDDVVVHEGYAIDCDGHDIVVPPYVDPATGETGPTPLHVLDRVRGLASTNGGLVATHGTVTGPAPDGEYAIVLGLDDELRHTFTVEPYDPPHGLASILRGTLLWDFFEDCVQPIVKAVKAQLTPALGEENLLPGPTQERLTTLLNLIVQLFVPAGRFVFLSKREHVILERLYQELGILFRSSTFCALGQLDPFPTYPFDDEPTTIFAQRAFQKRLRVDAEGTRAYSVGAGRHIHVFDLESERMVADLEFPPGQGTIVRDVAFSVDGTMLWAIAASPDNQDTFFAAADIAQGYTWGPVSVVCAHELLTLATAHSRSGETLYAASKGEGLFTIDPTDQTPQATQTSMTGKTVGHLIIDEASGMGVVTTQLGTSSLDEDEYNAVQPFTIDPTGTLYDGTDTLLTVQQKPVSGHDDVAFARRAQAPKQPLLLVVVDPESVGAGKRLIATADLPSFEVVKDDLEDTIVRLAWDARGPQLLVSYADSFQAVALSVDTYEWVSEYRFPLQISPVSLVYAPETASAYALNYTSNTVTTMPREFLDTPVDVPTLTQYRDDVLAAFARLFGRFLEYLKDCLCNHLLVDCLECDGTEKLYLGTVEVRGGSVYHVCNFEGRRYVKSFPTVQYWLSLVPVLPLVAKAVETFCCVLPSEPFAKVDTSKTVVRSPLRTGHTVAAVTFLQTRGLQTLLLRYLTLAGRKNPLLRRLLLMLGGKRVGPARMPMISNLRHEGVVPRLGEHDGISGTPVPAAPAPGGEEADLRAEIEKLRGELRRLDDRQRRRIREVRAEVDRLRPDASPDD